MLGSVTAIAVVGVQMRDLAHVRHACAAPIAAVMPSADWMLVRRKVNFGFGTALSNRKSVQPSTNMVSSASSSATGRAPEFAARDDAGEEDRSCLRASSAASL